MDLLSLALVVALVAWSARKGWRWWQARASALARARRPGWSADHPLRLSSPRVVEAAVDEARCACGGRVRSIGEGPRLGLRVVRCRCLECEEDLELYFELPHLLH